MRPRAIYTFSSIFAVLLCMFFSDGRLPHFYTIWNYGHLLVLEASEWIGYISIHLNAKVSNTDVCRSCIHVKCEDKCVCFAAISIIIV